MTPSEQLVETIRREAKNLPTLVIDEIVLACVLELKERRRHEEQSQASACDKTPGTANSRRA